MRCSVAATSLASSAAVETAERRSPADEGLCWKVCAEVLFLISRAPADEAELGRLMCTAATTGTDGWHAIGCA